MSATDWLNQPLRRTLGAATAKALAALDVETVGDLLEHRPRRYTEHGQLSDIGSLRVDEQATVLAEVAKVSTRRMRQRKGTITEVVITDGHHPLVLTFFNQVWRDRQLQPGVRGLFAGTVSVRNGQRQLTHPECVVFGGGHEGDPASDVDRDLGAIEQFTDYLIPIYPASAALPSWRIQKAVGVLLDTLPDLPDVLPAEVVQREQLLSRADAVRTIHRPKSMADVAAARRRLAYDEAFVLQTVLARRRAALASRHAVPRVSGDDGLLSAFDDRLPFTFTEGQSTVSADITADLAKDHPMHRLLQGEVGSGKTVVALRAMVTVVDAGGQAALLAPTEVLAQQHFRTMSAMLGPLGDAGMLGAPSVATTLRLLTGSMPAAVRREALLDLASGDAGIVVGTHALLQENVDFFDLGLVVIDEQHRFGVEQREALRAKAEAPPHVLVMTATPIPRTVAMTIFGDLDVSTLTELPKGRQSVATHVVPAFEKPSFLHRTWERVTEEVALGHQVYVVCPKIGGALDSKAAPTDTGDEFTDIIVNGEVLPVPDEHSVTALSEFLADGPLAECRVAALHGQMPSDVKESTMSAFAAGEIDVLVATTVVEVGVDVPNASMMVVMDADRFGVSQLHQIRGRVGRGEAPGLCLLVTDLPPEHSARERLDQIASSNDGFTLARIDLEQRREGDVLGIAQSGMRSSLKVLRAVSDEDIIVAARADAVEVVAVDSDLSDHPDLRAAVERLEADEQSEFLEKS